MREAKRSEATRRVYLTDVPITDTSAYNIAAANFSATVPNVINTHSFATRFARRSVTDKTLLSVHEGEAVRRKVRILRALGESV